MGEKGRELAIAGKSDVLRRNRALVVPLDTHRTAEVQPSPIVEPSPTPEVYVSTETEPGTGETSSTEMHPATEMSPTLAKSPRKNNSKCAPKKTNDPVAPVPQRSGYQTRSGRAVKRPTRFDE